LPAGRNLRSHIRFGRIFIHATSIGRRHDDRVRIQDVDASDVVAPFIGDTT
jgi:hypothetical protein